MVDEWAYQGYNAASDSKIWGASLTSKSNVASISYVNGDGSERKNTWIWAIPAEDWIVDDYNDDQYRWFYAGKDGRLVNDKVKKINGKYYAFDKFGRMQVDFVEVGTDGIGVEKKAGHDKYTAAQWIDENLDGIFYFSSDEDKDGARKTGYQNIELADDTYQFYFQKNGEGKTQYDSKIKKFTVAGLVLKPTNDDDNNYAVIKDITVTDKGEYVVGDEVEVVTAYNNMYDDGEDILVNKQGSIIKNKTVKDENDQYWKTNDYGQIVNKAPDKEAYDKLKKASQW